MRLLTGRLRDQWHGMSRTGRVAAAFAHSPEPTLRMHPGDAQRRGLVAGELVQIASKRGALVLPLELSDELRSGTVFAPMHWSGQSLSSGGINEVSTPAVDARSQQPELKHTAVRVEKTTFGWHLLAARRGDAIALQQTLQPLLRDCGYASLRLHAEPSGGSRRHASGDWVVLHAACERAPDATWMDRPVAALHLPAGADVLEYRDLRRGLMRRVGWRMHDGHHHIDGVLLTAAQPSDAKIDRCWPPHWLASRGMVRGCRCSRIPTAQLAIRSCAPACMSRPPRFTPPSTRAPTLRNSSNAWAAAPCAARACASRRFPA